MAFTISSIKSSTRRYIVEYGLLDKEDNLTESGQVFFSGLLPLLRHNIKLLQNPDRQKKVSSKFSEVI